MLQLANCLGLDLPHALARHFKDAADLLQRVRVAVSQTVAQLDNFALPISQRLERLLNLVFEHLLGSRTDRRFGTVVLDEVAKIAVFTFANRSIQADRMPADLQDAASFLNA